MRKNDIYVEMDIDKEYRELEAELHLYVQVSKKEREKIDSAMDRIRKKSAVRELGLNEIKILNVDDIVKSSLKRDYLRNKKVGKLKQ